MKNYRLIAALLLVILPQVVLGEIVNFDIDLKYKRNNDIEKVHYNIRSKLNHSFAIEKNGLKVRLKANRLPFIKSSKKILHISGEVFELRNGVKKIIAEPEIITKINQNAVLRFEEAGEFFELSLKPTLI